MLPPSHCGERVQWQAEEQGIEKVQGGQQWCQFLSALSVFPHEIAGVPLGLLCENMQCL